MHTIENNPVLKEILADSYGAKRNFSVQVLKNERGEVTGHYASEYRDCGNGAYYILMSPKQALYAEHD